MKIKHLTRCAGCLAPALLSGFLWFVGAFPVSAQSPVEPARSRETTVTTGTISIPAYDVTTELHYNSTYNMFYDKLTGVSGSVTHSRTFTLITLENTYLRLTLLPELGGRIYQAIYKPTGHNLFYQNPVLKPSPWGPPEMGGWTAAGGMEWCLPVEEHGYEWGITWAYRISDTADGMTVIMRDTDATNRLRARIEITLPDDAARFQVSPTIENPTAQPIDFQFWLNAMLAPGPANAPTENLHILMPTDQVTLHSSGIKNDLPGEWQPVNWPLHNGVDWSRLGNWDEWFGFFQRPQAAGDFQAVYDTGFDEGVVRTYDSTKAWGAKFFAFGWEHPIAPGSYTDDGSGYVEIHGGAGATFHPDDRRRLEAGQSLTWDERWYPVAGLGDLTWANAEIALYLEQAAGQTELHLAATRPLTDVRVLLLRLSDSTILLDQNVSTLTPDAPYHSISVATGSLSVDDLGVLVYQGEMRLAAYQFEGEIPDFSLDISPSDVLFLLDDATVSRTRTVYLTTRSATPLTWTAHISPAADWATVQPISGTVSGVAPVTVTLNATRVLTFGMHTTTLTISAVTLSGQPVDPATADLRLVYVAQLFDIYLPLILKSF